MGDQHFHITSVLIEDADRVERFIAAAREHFRAVEPLWHVETTTGRMPLTVAFYSKDFDNISSELEMPDIAKALSGILERDIEIVSAWERHGGVPGRPRHRVWRVTGANDPNPLPPITDPDDPQFEYK